MANPPLAPHPPPWHPKATPSEKEGEKLAEYKNISYLCNSNTPHEAMPEICRFYGIIISLYWRDHNPPHIHFTYGGLECSITVINRIVSGTAPTKIIEKVNKWIDMHEDELLTLWEKAQKGEKLDKIEPLKP